MEAVSLICRLYSCRGSNGRCAVEYAGAERESEIFLDLDYVRADGFAEVAEEAELELWIRNPGSRGKCAAETLGVGRACMKAQAKVP